MGSSAPPHRPTPSTEECVIIEPGILPSSKYMSMAEPSPTLLKRAQAPPRPVLPRRGTIHVCVGALTAARERDPLTASLTGSARAGKHGCLEGNRGSYYEGEVLAGRPHGRGRLYVPGNAPRDPSRLVYEGDFVKGVRHGRGRALYSNGEVYEGDWVAGRRCGQGRLTYADGSAYEGAWHRDQRHGIGTMHGTYGDVFVGTFVRGRRQGLATIYMPMRGRKLIAQYLDDRPVCSVMYELQEQQHHKPPSSQAMRGDALVSMALEHACTAGALCNTGPPLPELQLASPGSTLGAQLLVARQQLERYRRGGSDTNYTLDGTLSAESMALLRHAFVLLAGGDGPCAALPARQLRDLLVLAGLDPATQPGAELEAKLHDLCLQNRSSPDGALTLEVLMDELCHHRRQVPPALQPQPPA